MTKQEKLNEELFNQHCDYIYSVYGEDVSANFGWVQGDDEFCTKIYSDPREYVTSIRKSNGEIEHTITTD